MSAHTITPGPYQSRSQTNMSTCPNQHVPYTSVISLNDAVVEVRYNEQASMHTNQINSVAVRWFLLKQGCLSYIPARLYSDSINPQRSRKGVQKGMRFIQSKAGLNLIFMDYTVRSTLSGQKHPVSRKRTHCTKDEGSFDFVNFPQSQRNIFGAFNPNDHF
ncbi:hypothetical protein TNCV_576101 [Trichonephila clavipes]|nr:hypothetical protein TNCV_576101 [Trichonephila clavipes]